MIWVENSTSSQLSWFQVGLAVLWQGDNAAGSKSLPLRMLYSVLIRPLAASLPLSLTAAFSSLVCKSENNSQPPPVIPAHHFLPRSVPLTSDCVALLQ